MTQPASSDKRPRKYTFPQKVASRVYRMTSGVSANFLRSGWEAASTLAQLSGVEVLEWQNVFQPTQDGKALGELFVHYGSDKATRHNYHLIYASLLSRSDSFNLLEIGLGTTNPSIQYHMGPNGKPGAAERAFRDWAPQANIFGADVDEQILFREERIETFFVDQMRPETLAALATKVPPLDLVIDDGLHRPDANLNTIAFALPLLKPRGAMVIEDILPEYINFWRLVVSVLDHQFDCQLIKMKAEHVVIIRPRS